MPHSDAALPAEEPSDSPPRLMAPPAGVVYLPASGTLVDPYGLVFHGLEITSANELRENGRTLRTVEGLAQESVQEPMSSGITLAVQPGLFGYGRLGDVLAGQAYFPAPRQDDSQPKGKRPKLRAPAQSLGEPTEVVIKLVCPELLQESEEWEDFDTQEILGIFTREARRYLLDASAQQGKTIARCYGFFRAQTLVELAGQLYMRAPREGEKPRYNVYGLVLERLGGSIAADDGGLATDVDVFVPLIVAVDIADHTQRWSHTLVRSIPQERTCARRCLTQAHFASSGPSCRYRQEAGEEEPQDCCERPEVPPL